MRFLCLCKKTINCESVLYLLWIESLFYLHIYYNVSSYKADNLSLEKKAEEANQIIDGSSYFAADFA